MFDRFNESLKKTKFAPAKRLGKNTIKEQSSKLAESEFLDNVLSKIPFVFLIVNGFRQVVYSNETLIKSLGFEDLGSVIGLRPGEMFSCVHAYKEEGGCGTSENCRVCGAVQSMMESKKNNDLVTKESRLTIKVNGQEVAQDFEIASKPFNWREEKYYIITLNDISSKKRKDQLERVFFHDLINKAGSVSGLINLMISRTDDADENKSLLSLAERTLEELMSDINFQKQLQQAEQGKLELSPKKENSLTLLKNLKDDFLSLTKRQNKAIEIDPESEDFEIFCDLVLLNRIITNLTKNALEAIESEEKVVIALKKKGKTFLFSTWNPTVMSPEVKSQVFQRSFSTKGPGRGLGTYSVKLFTEMYLNGMTDFTSDEGKGTMFTVELPLNLKVSK